MLSGEYRSSPPVTETLVDFRLIEHVTAPRRAMIRTMRPLGLRQRRRRRLGTLGAGFECRMNRGDRRGDR